MCSRSDAPDFIGPLPQRATYDALIKKATYMLPGMQVVMVSRWLRGVRALADKPRGHAVRDNGFSLA